MTLDDIKQIIVAGFKSAFMPFHIKQECLRRATEELERFSADGGVKPMPAVSPRAVDPESRRAEAPVDEVAN